MSSTNRIKNFKDFDTQLEIIELINSWDKVDVVLIKENEFSTKGKITKHEKKIHIEINDLSFPHFNNFEKINGIKANIEGFECSIDSFYINSTSTKLDETAVERVNVCSLNIIKDNNFKTDKSKYQCFMSTEASKMNTFHYQFETVTYQDKETEYFYDCLRINKHSSNFKFINK